MIRTIRALFLGCGLREKLLLVGLITIFVLVWLSNFGSRTSLFWRQQKATTVTLEDQRFWLSNRAEIEAAALKSASQFDAANTLTAPGLYATMNQLASEAGLKPGVVQEKDEPGGQFIVHSVRVQFSQADWDSSLRFYRTLSARSPYITLEQFQFTTDGRAHRASMRVSSVEIVH
jgi:hypothetical protein